MDSFHCYLYYLYDSFNSGDVSLAALDGKGIKRANESGKKARAKQIVSGDIIEFAVEAHAAQNGIEIALMVTDQQNRSLKGYIFTVKDADVEKGGKDHLSKTLPHAIPKTHGL